MAFLCTETINATDVIRPKDLRLNNAKTLIRLGLPSETDAEVNQIMTKLTQEINKITSHLAGPFGPQLINKTYEQKPRKSFYRGSTNNNPKFYEPIDAWVSHDIVAQCIAAYYGNTLTKDQIIKDTTLLSAFYGDDTTYATNQAHMDLIDDNFIR